MRYRRSHVLAKLKRGDEQAFKHIFNAYYEKLFYYALKFLHSKEIAEEVVQDVLITIWEKRKELDIHTSIQSYLYTSVKNKSLSYLRSKYSKTEFQSIQYTEFESAPDLQTEHTVDCNELEILVKNMIDSLPERCKIIFRLSRNSGLTYKQIANELNISSESVKTQIGIALKKIKLHLEKYWDQVAY